jgi:hypothetical protein
LPEDAVAEPVKLIMTIPHFTGSTPPNADATLKGCDSMTSSAVVYGITPIRRIFCPVVATLVRVIVPSLPVQGFV